MGSKYKDDKIDSLERSLDSVMYVSDSLRVRTDSLLLVAEEYKGKDRGYYLSESKSRIKTRAAEYIDYYESVPERKRDSVIKKEAIRIVEKEIGVDGVFVTDTLLQITSVAKSCLEERDTLVLELVECTNDVVALSVQLEGVDSVNKRLGVISNEAVVTAKEERKKKKIWKRITYGAGGAVVLLIILLL